MVPAFDNLRLTWRDDTDAQLHESTSELLELRTNTAVVSLDQSLPIKSEVSMSWGKYTTAATVVSCEPNSGGFVIALKRRSGSKLHFFRPALRGWFDPGVLAIEKFLTEEQEERILRELELATHPADTEERQSPKARRHASRSSIAKLKRASGAD